jgi:hypothetical protein
MIRKMNRSRITMLPSPEISITVDDNSQAAARTAGTNVETQRPTQRSRPSW